MEKPLRSPKPPGISLAKGDSTGQKSLVIQDNRHKVKPPLLPKPVLKPKPIISHQKPVIQNKHDEKEPITDVVNIKHFNNVIGIFEAKESVESASRKIKAESNVATPNHISGVDINKIVNKFNKETSTEMVTSTSKSKVNSTKLHINYTNTKFVAQILDNSTESNLSSNSKNEKNSIPNNSFEKQNSYLTDLTKGFDIPDHISGTATYDELGTNKVNSSRNNQDSSHFQKTTSVNYQRKENINNENLKTVEGILKSTEEIDYSKGNSIELRSSKEDCETIVDRESPNKIVKKVENLKDTIIEKVTPSVSFLHKSSISSPKLSSICDFNEAGHSIIEETNLKSTHLNDIRTSSSDSCVDLTSKTNTELTENNSFVKLWEQNSLKKIQRSNSCHFVSGEESYNCEQTMAVINGNKEFQDELNVERSEKSTVLSESPSVNNCLKNPPEPECDINYDSSVNSISSQKTKYHHYEKIVLKTENVNDDLSDLSDISDGSVVSDTSGSDFDMLPNSSTLHSLVKCTFNITGVIGVLGDSNDSFQYRKGDNTRKVKRKSIEKGSEKLKRTSSNRSNKSRQEDMESIGSNSSDGSSMRFKRLSSFFGIGRSSFGKAKSSSSFYQDSSPELSLTIDGPLPNELVNQNKDKDESDLPSVSTAPTIQDSTPLSEEELVEHKKRQAFLAAKEIMTSEKVFINVLSLLCKDMKEACQAEIPENELSKITHSLPTLLYLSEDLLKDIEERIENWEHLPKIADIFVKKGPFLKLFSTYIENFESQCNYLDECCLKYPLFDKKIKEFEMHVGEFRLRSYMHKPIQRLPQYKLMLEKYFKQLDTDSVDYEDTQKALSIASDAADHANSSMKKYEHLTKLLQIQSQLGNYEIIKPYRKFIKEGELFKLSRKGLQVRFFILLSDCLLCTSYYGTMTGLKVNYELPLNGMKISLNQAEDYDNEFSIISTARSFKLRARTTKERQEWIDVLQNAINERDKHRLSFLIQESDTQHSNSGFKLGKEAPVWTPDKRVTMCQLCTSVFTVTFRRHHCRACGKVVCRSCSEFKAPLQYKRFQSARVCIKCYQYLKKEFDDQSSDIFDSIKSVLSIEENDNVFKTIEAIRSNFNENETTTNTKCKKYVPTRLIEVTANDSGAQMSGWLFQRYKKQNWKQFWFVLKEQVLYKYKASEDIAALASTVLLGYEVKTLSEHNMKFIFQLEHEGQDPMVFGTNNEQAFNKWITSMEEASKLK